jgi:phosphate acetyltransferase
MARSIYLASVEGHTAKSVVALGVLEALKSKHKTIGIFRAVVPSRDSKDRVLELLLSKLPNKLDYQACIGVGYQELHESSDRALEVISQRYQELATQCDAVLVIGSDYTDEAAPAELSFNARVAANIGAPLLIVFSGREVDGTDTHLGQAPARAPKKLARIAEVALREINHYHATLLGIVVNRADTENLTKIESAVMSVAKTKNVFVVPEDPYLMAPTLGEIQSAIGGKLVLGSKERLQSAALDVVVASMSVPNVLTQLMPGAVVAAPSDRTDVLLALLMADSSETFPKLAGVVINGGFEMPEPIKRLIKGLKSTLPVISVATGSFDSMMGIIQTRGSVSLKDTEKTARALKLITKYLPRAALAKLVADCVVKVVTPLMFEQQLVLRASKDPQTIVLPEGSDDRILRAAAEVLERKVANLIILGSRADIKKRAEQMKLNLSAAKIIDIKTSPEKKRFAASYETLRKHKGITNQQALETMSDLSYFGTMLVHEGLADGMVSGAAHTTAQTITPAFEIIKTNPGALAVSSVFLMALEDRVVVYGDCAVIPEPTVEQLADIAISSSETARQFGIEPQVAMLSYSTGESGSGAEVDRVRQATKLAKKLAPKLPIEGPIQFDAAVDAAVALAKLPGSSVAGRATVFVFPDLNTGNNTYKAVQRTSGALAIGPVLQGLRKPVNDLSRGATVKDIVNTIAITAIQAQGKKQ